MAYLGKKPNNKYARQSSGKMTFFSQGTGYEFNPNWLINIDNKRITLLELHTQEVKSRNNPTCYILNSFGEVLPK